MSVPFSILDVVGVPEGTPDAVALRRLVELARLGDELGFARLWYAEHHSFPTIASSSPELLIAHAAAHTQRIRLGSGGVMLPNHAPLRIAEQYKTLEALHPGRIDLGIGRAGGTDPRTLRALYAFAPERFPEQVHDLRGFGGAGFPEDHPFASVRAVPEDVALPPIWILGSSGASAGYAGSLGLGYGFAAHFATASPVPALQAYRRSFKPSAAFPAPHAIVCVGVICAETDEEADWLAKSSDLMWVRMHRMIHEKFPSPETAAAFPYTDADRAIIAEHRRHQAIGSPETVRRKLQQLLDDCGADEIMLSSNIHDQAARLRSHRLVKEHVQLLV